MEALLILAAGSAALVVAWKAIAGPAHERMAAKRAARPIHWSVKE